MNLTAQINPKLVQHYYRQYIQNYKGLNMEFAEFISSKLQLSEYESLAVIREWKNNLAIVTK